MVLRIIVLSGLFLLNIAFSKAQNPSFKGMVLIPKGSYLPLYSGNSKPEEGPAFYVNLLREILNGEKQKLKSCLPMRDI